METNIHGGGWWHRSLRFLVKLSSDLLILSGSSSTGGHSPSNGNVYQVITLGVNYGRCDEQTNPTVTTVPNLTVNLKARHFIPSLNLHDLLRKNYQTDAVSTQVADQQQGVGQSFKSHDRESTWLRQNSNDQENVGFPPHSSDTLSLGAVSLSTTVY
jgi:hypothetical protein